MYKSNSSLDLDHEVDILQESTVLTGAHSSGGQSRREYGSHGSLDMMGRGLTHGGEAVSGAALNGGMFAQPGDGPVAVSTLTRPGAQPGAHLDRSEDSAAGSVISTSSQDQGEEVWGATSPKTKRKAITGFWGSNSKDKNSRKSQKSLFKKRPKEGSEGLVRGEASSCDSDNKAEDKHRRRFFSHYDTASVCASLSVTAQLRTLQRRNTTTGASAASAALRGGGTDSLDSDVEADTGDGVNNDCVLR